MLGHLLVAGAPVSIPELIDALADRFGGCVDAKRISDVLRYQVGLGRVRRLERGVYEIVPGVVPRSTAWRCVNWQREQLRWWEEYVIGRS